MKFKYDELDNTFRELASIFVNLKVIGDDFEDWGIVSGQDDDFVADQFSRIQSEYSASIVSIKPNSKHC